MKCNNCGKEFGDGLTCQYCGCERVKGLGSFSGYDPGKGSAHIGGQESLSIVPNGKGGR